MPKSEKILWHRLRRDNLGARFRRQVPVGPYVLDFYCPELRLCIEVDGELHDVSRDAHRDSFLADRGIFTIRIPSMDLFAKPENLDSWVETIWRKVEELRDQTPP